ncbi:MAG: phage terminase small subunit P27 family [Bacillota bacterium]|nr:phage terminase small subunit P27 family [Bacillota bacterium]
MAKITCPTWLDLESKKEWKRIIKLLEEEKKDFTQKDLKALEGYVVNYSKWKRCEQIISEKGFSMKVNDEGYEQQRPEISIGNKAQQEMRSWMKELGLTEASRARMNKNAATSITDGYNDDDKKMEALLND